MPGRAERVEPPECLSAARSPWGGQARAARSASSRQVPVGRALRVEVTARRRTPPVVLLMTRATRFAMLAGCAALLYLIFLVGIVPVPLVPASVADAVLPTVRRRH